MKEMSDYLPQFESNDIAVHAITAQPGGDDVVRQMLKDEGAEFAFPIHSDPQMKLCVSGEDGKPTKEMYVHNKIDKSREYLDGVQEYEVQPAVVVADAEGNVTQWWSWRSHFKGNDLDEAIADTETMKAQWHEYVDYGDKDFDDLDPALVPISLKEKGIEVGDASDNTEDKTWIVNVRPPASDLLAAVLNGQPLTAKEVISISQVRNRHLTAVGILKPNEA